MINEFSIYHSIVYFILDRGLIDIAIIVICYVIARSLKNNIENKNIYHRIFNITLLCFIIYNSVLCWLQFFGVTDLYRNQNYLFTGSLGNPNLVAFVLGISLLWFLLYARDTKSQESIFLLLFACVLTIPLLVISKCRSVWLSLIFFIFLILKEQKFIKILREKHKYIFEIVVFLGIFLAAIVFLYLKLDSVIGRIFIWKISFKIFRDYSVFGIGFNNFKKYYLTYQTNYFETNYDVKNMLLSGTVITPYCEYIKLLVETGIVGIFLFGIFLILHLKKQDFYYSTVRKPAALVLFILVFSLFNYGFTFQYICLIFIIALAFLPKNRLYFRMNRYIQYIDSYYLIKLRLILLIISVLIMVITYIEKTKSEKMIKTGQYTTTRELDSIKNYPYSFYDPAIVINIIETNSIDSSSIFDMHAFINKIHYRVPFSPEINLSIANFFEQTNKNAIAEKYYLRAWYCRPVSYRYRLHLVEFYNKTGQCNKALNVAKETEQFPIKVNSYEVRDIRSNIIDIANGCETYQYLNR